MDWQLLKTMQCPGCGGSLKDSGVGYRCQHDAGEVCDFYISYDKFRDVVNSFYKQRPKYYDPDAVDRSDWD